MRRKFKNAYQTAEHRGNVREVIRNFQLEMKLINNFNKQNNPVHSIEEEEE